MSQKYPDPSRELARRRKLRELEKQRRNSKTFSLKRELQIEEVPNSEIVKGSLKALAALGLIGVMAIGGAKFVVHMYQMGIKDLDSFGNFLAGMMNPDYKPKTNSENLKTNTPEEKEVVATITTPTKPRETEPAYKPVFAVGNDQQRVQDTKKILASEIGNYIYQYSDQYGVDANLMAAICNQESNGDHYRYCTENDAGIGAFQIEASGLIIPAYNYNTNQVDNIELSRSNLYDIEYNTCAACAMVSYLQGKYGENLAAVLQAYNYGEPMLNKILYTYNVDKNDTTNLSWLEGVKDAHQNPSKYISGWGEATYGDGDYCKNVYRGCISDTVTYKYHNNGKITKITTRIADNKNLSKQTINIQSSYSR